MVQQSHSYLSAYKSNTVQQYNAYMLVEVPCVSQEGGRQQNVPDNGGHLRTERLARRLPTFAFHAERFQQSYGTINLHKQEIQLI